jgi:hypothetical protein
MYELAEQLFERQSGRRPDFMRPQFGNRLRRHFRCQHAYAERDWYSDSVDQYVRADHADSTSRGDPQMLADLLKATAHPVAARAIRDIYGAEAIPSVDKAIKSSVGDWQATARLARLPESLPR